MKTSPQQLSTRYLPFLVVAAVLSLLVVVAPSKGGGTGDTLATGPNGTDFSGAGAPDSTAGAGDGSFAGDGSGAGNAGVNADGTAPDAAVPSGSDGQVSGTDAGGSGADTSGVAPQPAGGGGASGNSGSGSNSGTGGNSGSGGNGSGKTAPNTGGSTGQASTVDRSRCDSNGMQKGPVYPTGVRCRPVFSGDNGGATMQGVTAKEIRYVWYNPPQNPAVNGLLAAGGFAREPQNFCPAMRAFEKSLQKYFETSGRKLVALDGPGGAAGSRDCDGKYRYFQSQCSSGAPDSACYRAEAATIATQLKPAFVIAEIALPVFHEELARRKTIVLGYGGSRSKFQQFAPYAWGPMGLSSERTMQLGSEYFCKRLVGENAKYGGNDVKNTKRHVGLVYPENGDGSLQPAVNLWLKNVRGCGDSNAKAFTYVSDATRAQQQSTNIAAQLKADGVTTVAFCCDPVSYVFFLQAFDQSAYTPEHLTLGFSSIASDVVGQIYYQLGYQNQWKHAFGNSNFAINRPDATLDYRKAYADGGGPGGSSKVGSIEISSFGFMYQMMQMIHTAGPNLNPVNVFKGMQALPRVPATKISPSFDYAAPDPFVPQLDVAEVWYNPNLRSPYNGSMGAMCYVNGAKRYGIGEFPSARTNLFTGGNAACAKP